MVALMWPGSAGQAAQRRARFGSASSSLEPASARCGARAGTAPPEVLVPSPLVVSGPLTVDLNVAGSSPVTHPENQSRKPLQQLGFRLSRFQTADDAFTSGANLLPFSTAVA